MNNRLLRLLAALMALTLVAAACGNDDGDDVATDDDTEQVDTDRDAEGAGGGDEADDAGDDGEVAGGDAGGDDGATDGGSDGEPAGGGGTNGTTGGGGGATDGGGEQQTAIQPTAPGEYHITVDGTARQGAQSQDMPDRTLEVQAPDGQRQIQVTTADDGSSRTELDVEFTDEGVRLHRISISQQGFNRTFRFSPPVLAATAVPEAGQKWSWSGTSDNGQTTLEASFEVLETGVTVNIGGQPVQTYKMRSILKTAGDLESTSNDVQWLSPEHRLIVKTEGSSEGSFGPIAFSSEYVWTLDSVTPA